MDASSKRVRTWAPACAGATGYFRVTVSDSQAGIQPQLRRPRHRCVERAGRDARRLRQECGDEGDEDPDDDVAHGGCRAAQRLVSGDEPIDGVVNVHDNLLSSVLIWMLAIYTSYAQFSSAARARILLSCIHTTMRPGHATRHGSTTGRTARPQGCQSVKILLALIEYARPIPTCPAGMDTQYPPRIDHV